jgi:hypothetical protein
MTSSRVRVRARLFTLDPSGALGRRTSAGTLPPNSSSRHFCSGSRVFPHFAPPQDFPADRSKTA